MTGNESRFHAVILDIDGVLWTAGAPGTNATDLIRQLVASTIPFCLLTNGCEAPKAIRYAALIRAGFVLKEDQLITAPEVTGEWLRDNSVRSLMYLGVPGVLSDFAGGISVRTSGPVDAVIIGDLFESYNRQKIGLAVDAIASGADLIAMHSNRRWSDGKDWHVDIGFWVAGFEYVTGRRAVIIGKPSAGAYLTALRRLGEASRARSATLFVSDDIEVDLKGAKEVGLSTMYLGPPCKLPAWVDGSVDDIAALQSVLAGRPQ